MTELPPINCWQYRDHRGDIMPWFTDGFLKKLIGLDLSTANVLEWGSGWSTLWWAKNAKSILSIEHNLDWCRTVNDRLEDYDGSRLCTFAYNLQDYLKLPPNAYFDIIVIDGAWRVECAQEALQRVAIGGFIILDNSNYPEHQPIHDLLGHCEKHTYIQTEHPDWQTTCWQVDRRSPIVMSYEDAAKAQSERRAATPGSEVLA